MSPQEKALWASVQRRADSLTPAVAARVLRAFKTIRDGMTDTQIARALATGGVERLFQDVLNQALLDVAMQPVREEMRRGVVQSFRYTATTLPRPPATASTLTISFDVLNPRIVTAVRTLETGVIGKLSADIRETVRAYVEQGLRTGVHPHEVGRQIRSLIGLAPSRAKEAENLLRELTEGRYADARRRLLLDRRYNLDSLATLSDSARATRIEMIVEAYRKRKIAKDAATTAMTAAQDATKLGQKLSWDDAIAKGIVDRARMRKTWVHFDAQPEPRPEHAAMQGETVPFDQPFSNGQMIPGVGDYGCKCIARYWQASA